MKSFARILAASVLCAVLGTGSAEAQTAVAPGCLIHSPARSSAARYAFRKAHPCPANGSALGACPGWEVHHLWPLCCGGPDTPENMIWLTTAQHEVVTTKLVCKGSK